jgi:hypothetical protein
MSNLKFMLKRWWYLGVILVAQCLPPVTVRGYSLMDWGKVNAFILTHPIRLIPTSIFSIFKIIPLILVIAIFLGSQKALKVFFGYIAGSYILMAFLQNISIQGPYGLAICTSNVVCFLFLSGLWMKLIYSPRMDINNHKQPIWKYLLLILALIPFWEPVDPVTLGPDFNPIFILTSGAGLSFCLSTPLFLVLMLWTLPKVDQPAFIATGLVGTLLGVGNLILEFWLIPSFWWIGVLHFPLVIISLITLVIGLRTEIVSKRFAS